MRSMRTLLILRGVIAALVTGLAVVSFVNGRVVVGVLLSALAVTNVVLIATFARRRRAFRGRFPGFAAGQHAPD